MTFKDQIRSIAAKHASLLRERIDHRMKEMRTDDTSHYYRLLGITNEEGRSMDMYQNKGRFLYRHAGSFLEEAATHCFKSRFPEIQISQDSEFPRSTPENIRD